MLFRRGSSAVYVAVSLAVAAAPGCGGKDPGRPDAATADAPDPDAPVFRDTAVTIRAFPDGFPYTGRTENALLVAFQTGDGPWVALTGTGGVYHATATTPRYGVAVACVADFGSNIQLFYQTVDDTKDVRADGCPSKTGMVHLTVNLLGVDSGDRDEVWFGSTVGGSLAGDPIELDVPKGTVEVFVKSLPATGGPVVPRKLLRGPTVDVQTSQTLQYDLGGLGKPLESHPLTVSGLDAAESVRVHSSYATPHSQVQWPLLTANFPGAPDSYVTLDATARQAVDISNITVIASSTTGGKTFERSLRQAFKNPVAQTVTLPPAWTANAPTLNSAEAATATVTIPVMPATLGISDYTVSLSTDASATVTSRALSLLVRSGWAGSQSSVTISTPDLTGLPGWGPLLALTPGVPVSWSIERDDRNMPYEALATDGRRILYTRVSGQITP